MPGDPPSHLVLPPIYSRRILRASALTLFSVGAAAGNGLPLNCFLASAVFCTSVNYWRWPTLGWRRNIDMCCACGALLYQVVVTSAYTNDSSRRLYIGLVALVRDFLVWRPARVARLVLLSGSCCVCDRSCVASASTG